MVSPLLRNSQIIYKILVIFTVGAEMALITAGFAFQGMCPVL